MKGWAICLAAILLLATFTVMSPVPPAHAAFGPHKNVSQSSSEDSTLSPNKGRQIAVSGNNIYVIWIEFTVVYMARSTDGGLTFDPPVPVHGAGGGTPVFPEVVAVPGYVYALWEKNGTVWFARSADSGANLSFDTPIAISSTGVPTFARIAASGSLVIVAWADLSSWDIFSRQSTDNGASFEPPVNISNDAESSFYPAIAIGDEIYVAWSSTTACCPSDTSILFSKSSNGANFTSSVIVGSNEGVNEGAEIAVDGSNVHLGWIDNSSGRLDIWHGFSADGGDSSFDVTNVSDLISNDISGNLRQLTMRLYGSAVLMAWADDGDGNARMAYSPDNFQLNTTIVWALTSGTSTLPRIAVLDDVAYLFYQECDGSCNIYYNTVEIDGNAFLPIEDEINLTEGAGGNSITPHAEFSANAAYVAWTFADGPLGEVMFARNPDVAANAGPDQNALEGALVELDGTDSSGLDGDTLTFSWVQIAGPSVTLSGADTATPTFTAPSVGSTTVLTFELTVTATIGSSQDTVNISVNDMSGILNLSNNVSGTFLPSIAVSGTNVYAVWKDDASGDFDIMFSRSTDSGATFSAPVNLSDNSGDSIIPTVVAAGAQVFVVWTDDTPGNLDILMKRSTDSGATFGSVVNVSNDATRSYNAADTLSNGTLYVAWETGAAESTDILFSKSADGVSFSAPLNLSLNVSNSISPDVAVSGTDVYVAWADNTFVNYEILLSKSTDAGASFGPRDNISNNSSDSDLPRMSVTGSTVYLTWTDASPGDYDIFFKKSTDGAASFGGATNISNTAGFSYSQSIATTNDNVFIAWSEISSSADIMFRSSADGGSTFGSNTNLSNNSGNSFVPRIAASGKTIYAVWEDDSAGNSEAFFKKFEVNNQPVADAGTDQTTDEGNLVTLDGSASSDPDDDALTFSWTQISGPSVTLSGANTSSPTFTSPSITSTTTLTFQLVVNDGTIDSDPDTVDVTVNDRKGTLTIRKVVQGTSQLLEGAQFTITPNPFTLTSSLIVEDGIPQDADSTNGIIQLNNVEFGTFAIEETRVPAGFDRVVRTLTTSVHATQQSPNVIFENIPQGQPVEAAIDIPPPDLTSAQFNNFVLLGATVNNVAIQTVNDLPEGLLVPPAQIVPLPAITFIEKAPANSNIENLRSAYTIPTYSSPEQNLAANNVYIIPPIVIGQQGSDNKFVMTPVLERTLPGMTILFDNLTPTASGSGQLRNVEMTFTNAGSVNNAAFSISITDTVPPGTPTPPTTILQTSAMFLTVDFAGDFAGTDFSSSSAFQGSPKVRVLVDRNLDVNKLSDGCPDVSLFFFDEGPGQWITITDPMRVPSLDNSQYCGYELEPGHWSKFAIGGVKITANVLQSIIPSSGGGSSAASASTAAKTVNSGGSVSTSVTVGGKTIGLSFANVQKAGNVKVSISTPSKMSGIFSSVSGTTGKVVIASGQGNIPYATVGTVYEIDASGIEFSGPIELAIPYDPSLLPPFAPASELRVLHYADGRWEDVTSSVDLDAKVIKATLSSLSPIVAAIVDDGTFDDSYFSSNPLKKMSIVSAKPASVESWGAVLSATVKNAQRTDRDYAVIIQVLDSQGITQHVHISTGTLARGAEKEVSEPVELMSGRYTVIVMVWNSADAIPWPLCDPVKSSLRI